jgi:cytoskeletal protein RodZ
MGPRFQGPGHHSDNDLGSNHARSRLVEDCEKQTAVPSSLGQDLRQARQCRGLELSQISSSLKISKRYLTAIEESDVAGLPPGDVYRIGYTRAYAGYLGLNTGQCVEKLKTEIAAREAQSQAQSLTRDQTKHPMRIGQEPAPRHRLPSAVRHTFGFLGLL